MTDEDRELISELRRLASAGLHLHAADRLEKLAAVLEAAEELTHVIIGDDEDEPQYTLDSFSLQPLREAIRAARQP